MQVRIAMKESPLVTSMNGHGDSLEVHEYELLSRDVVSYKCAQYLGLLVSQAHLCTSTAIDVLKQFPIHSLQLQGSRLSVLTNENTLTKNKCDLKLLFFSSLFLLQNRIYSNSHIKTSHVPTFPVRLKNYQRRCLRNHPVETCPY